MECILSTAADGTELGGYWLPGGTRGLAGDVDRWEHWAVTSSMTFGKGKCYVVQWGQSSEDIGMAWEPVAGAAQQEGAGGTSGSTHSRSQQCALFSISQSAS